MLITVHYAQCDGCGRRVEATEIPEQWGQIHWAADGISLAACSVRCFGKAVGDMPTNANYLAYQFGLVPRDIQILELIAQGKTNAQVGFALGMSARSIRNRLNAYCARTLGASSRLELVVLADRFGLIDIREQAAKIVTSKGT